MIKKIKELNFPSYATLSKATVKIDDMAEKTITSQVEIDGEIAPDFSFDWEVEFDGEKYIMPLRTPQASKGNISLASKIDLTFQHWAIYQLKRWYFFTLQPVETGTAIADKYIAPISLNLKDFCAYFGQILNHYFGDAITIDLNPNPDVPYSEDATYIDINYSYLWGVLTKVYKLFSVHWEITSNGDMEHYVIRIGYGTKSISHVFEYGFKGGLMNVERQVQDDNIRNMLLGRGGDKNIPLLYFKDRDKNNESFQADPDWIPELANIHFDRLRSAEFRSYIQGWKRRHYNGEVTRDKTYVPWAWDRGYSDTRFNPVEFVKDDESIAKYGELMGGLDNNDEINPTIQGIVLDGIGRADQVVDVEQVTTDNVDYAQADKNIRTEQLGYLTAFEISLKANETKEITIDGKSFTIPEDWSGNIYLGEISKLTYDPNNNVDYTVQESNVMAYAVSNADGEEYPGAGISEGSYFVRVKLTLANTSASAVTISLTIKNVIVSMKPLTETREDTFDIWIKNIWQTEKLATETDEQYVERVWKPILGNHLGDEAAVCFSSGLLSTSEDYEFKILGAAITRGVHYDTSKELNGIPSHWRLTLVRSDADYDSLGKLVPNLERQGKAGDYFYFTGIELTHYYVIWAEQRLFRYKTSELDKIKDITPTWVVRLDKVRIGTRHYDDAMAIIEQLHIGNVVNIADKRFIGKSKQLSLYLQSITYKYNESADTANLTPNVEIVLGTDYSTNANPVQTLQGQIDSLAQQVSIISNIENAIRNLGDKRYLRKDDSDRTPYNLSVGGILTSENIARFGTFIKGFSGAQIDQYGNSEVESIVVRSYMKVFELIYNRLNALEGDTSFADSGTIETLLPNGGDSYTAVMRPRWDGDFTAFQIGDIIYGYVNNIGTSEDGRLVDESGDEGSLYYKAWALVKDVDRQANTLEITRYSGIDVPSGKNFPMESGMVVTRWGNTLNPEDPAVQANKEFSSFIIQRGGRWVNTRQQSFFISTEQGNLVELMGVNHPILRKENYGTVLGQIPDGLLDENTAKLINAGQPYLYARGIIVQDLIRIGYEGVTVKTPNFRGEWNETTARDESQYYRSTDDTVDVVTWNGALWQCVSQHASAEEPSDTNADWIRLTSSGFQVWQIVPSVNTVHIRGNGYSTNLIECSVTLQDGGGVREITTPEGLDTYGMELVFSLDGVGYNEFWVRKGAGIDGTGLQIGGNNVPWIEIQDNIWLTLRDKDTKEAKDAFIIPVTRDGEDGERGAKGEDGTDGSHPEMRYMVLSVDAPAPVITDKTSREPSGWVMKQPEVGALEDLWMTQATIDADNRIIGTWSDPIRLTGRDGKEGKEGERGLMPYPAGAFDELRTYRATETATPVVMYGTDGQGVGVYYALKRGMSYNAGSAEAGRKNPAEDYTHSNGAKYWERFDSFNLIFANVIMADFAKLGYGVFKDQYLFSQFGVDANGNAVSNYNKFGTPDFSPNFEVNLETGHLVIRSGEYYGLFRQKTSRIDEATYLKLASPVPFVGIEWINLGSSIVFTGGYEPTMTLPYLYDGITQESMDYARSFVGSSILVFNSTEYSYNGEKLPAIVRGEIWVESEAYETVNGHRQKTQKSVHATSVTIQQGYVREFRCRIFKDEGGYEQLGWEASDECKIRTTA